MQLSLKKYNYAKKISYRKLSKTLLLISTSLVNSNEHKTPFSFNLYYNFVLWHILFKNIFYLKIY